MTSDSPQDDMNKVFERRAFELAQLFKDERGSLVGRDVRLVPRWELTDNYHMMIMDVLWDHSPNSWYGQVWEWVKGKTTPQKQLTVAYANLLIDKFVRPQVASLGRIIGTMHKIRYASFPDIDGRKIGAFQTNIITDNVPLRITIEYLLAIRTGDYEWDAESGDLVPVIRPGTRIIVDALCQEARETCCV